MSVHWVSQLGGTFPAAPGAPPGAPPEDGPVSPEADLLREKIESALLAGRLVVPPYISDWTKTTPEVRRQLREMMTSPVVKPSVLSLAFAVASLDLNVHPATEDPYDRDVAEFNAYGFEHADGGAAQVALSIVLGGMIDGFSVMHAPMDVIDRGRYAGKWAFRGFRDKDIDELRLVVDRYRQVTHVEGRENGEMVRWPVNVSGSNLIVTQYLPIWGTPTGMSALRAAYGPWYRMKLTEMFRAIHLEKWTTPMLRGVYPPGDDITRKSLERKLERAKSRTWIAVPANVTVEAMALATRGESEYKAAIQDYTDQIVLSVTFATLQMLVANAGGDLRGDSKTQQSTSELSVWYLVKLVTNAYNQRLIPLQTEQNYSGADYPTATLGSVNDADMLASMTVDEGLARLGFDHSASATAKRYGRPRSSDPSDRLTPPAAAGGFGPVFAETADEPTAPASAPPGTVAPAGRMLTVPEVADMLRVSRGTVRGLCRSGQLGYFPVGSRYRIPAPALAAFLQGGLRPALPAAAVGDLPGAEPFAEMPGAEGVRAAELLGRVRTAAVSEVAEILSGAARRYVEAGLSGQPPAHARLSAADRTRLNETLAAAFAPADLLGRARLRELLEARAESFFADTPRARLAAFAEAPPPAETPEAALDYFLSLYPELGADPRRFGADMRRRAFTVAAAAEMNTLQKARRILTAALASGDVPAARADMETLLADAGLTEDNPSYPQMVVTTNLADAYNAGGWDEYSSPDLAEDFPAWTYSNPADSRSRPEHARKNGATYPRGVQFNDVRGTAAEDVCNCRCSFVPRHKSEVNPSMLTG